VARASQRKALSTNDIDEEEWTYNTTYPSWKSNVLQCGVGVVHRIDSRRHGNVFGALGQLNEWCSTEGRCGSARCSGPGAHAEADGPALLQAESRRARESRELQLHFNYNLQRDGYQKFELTYWLTYQNLVQAQQVPRSLDLCYPTSLLALPFSFFLRGSRLLLRRPSPSFSTGGRRGGCCCWCCCWGWWSRWRRGCIWKGCGGRQSLAGSRHFGLLRNLSRHLSSKQSGGIRSGPSFVWTALCGIFLHGCWFQRPSPLRLCFPFCAPAVL